MSDAAMPSGTPWADVLPNAPGDDVDIVGTHAVDAPAHMQRINLGAEESIDDPDDPS